MRIFVAGATGAVGSPLVRRLVQAGHSVVGTTHMLRRLQEIEKLGAQAILLDGLDRASVSSAIMAANPEVVVHQMTALGGMTDLRHFDRGFAQSNRLRTQGLDHLLAAALEVGARRIVVQSFCGWPYERAGEQVKSEAAPLDPHPPAQLRRTLEAIRYLERATVAAPIAGLALRYGYFYGPHTGMLGDVVLEQLARRRFPVIGDGGGWWSFVHVEDAASATVAAIERGPAGIYNIVDDEPAPVREWLPALARLRGAKPPPRVPAWLARILAGDHLVSMMTQGRAGSNAKARHELKWQPEFSSWRQGFAAALATSGAGVAPQSAAAGH